MPELPDLLQLQWLWLEFQLCCQCLPSLNTERTLACNSMSLTLKLWLRKWQGSIINELKLPSRLPSI
jgi:hypothetical protein